MGSTLIIGFEKQAKYLLTKNTFLIIKKNDKTLVSAKILDFRNTTKNSTLKIDKNLREGYEYYCNKANA